MGAWGPKGGAGGTCYLKQVGGAIRDGVGIGQPGRGTTGGGRGTTRGRVGANQGWGSRAYGARSMGCGGLDPWFVVGYRSMGCGGLGPWVVVG